MRNLRIAREYETRDLERYICRALQILRRRSSELSGEPKWLFGRKAYFHKSLFPISCKEERCALHVDRNDIIPFCGYEKNDLY